MEMEMVFNWNPELYLPGIPGIPLANNAFGVIIIKKINAGEL